MPEGDTIFRAAAALHRALAGDRVVRFETGFAHLARVHDDEPIAGRTGRAVRVDGQAPAHLANGRPRPAHAHADERFVAPLPARRVMAAPGERHAGASGHGRLGGGRVQRACRGVPHGRDIPRSKALATLGPDLLAATFDRAEALRRLGARRRPRPIAEVLLDQRVVAGIGNVFKSEVLFLCGIHPDRASQRHHRRGAGHPHRHCSPGDAGQHQA